MKKALKNNVSLLIVIILLLSLSISSFAQGYDSNGYRAGSSLDGTVYIKNNLNNSAIYLNHFPTAVAYWNSTNIPGRSFVINSTSTSIIRNFDFSESNSDSFQQFHDMGVAAVTQNWGKGTNYCTCHTTYAFDIICNDAYLDGRTSTFIRAIITHELGHTLGLIDFENSYGGQSIMSYDTDWTQNCRPFEMDIENATECWAPHYNQ